MVAQCEDTREGIVIDILLPIVVVVILSLLTIDYEELMQPRQDKTKPDTDNESVVQRILRKKRRSRWD
jgi:hypothetical protein